MSEVLDGVGVGVRLLRILGVGVRIFDPTPTPSSIQLPFNMLCLFIFTCCTIKQFMGFLTMKLWEGVASAFRLFF